MKGFGDLQKMLKTAQEMQERLQRELADLRVEGSSGGGVVTVVLDGQKNLHSLRLDPEVVNKDDVPSMTLRPRSTTSWLRSWAAWDPG
jgi:DNA-binding YbaB/EbfC family protein